MARVSHRVKGVLDGRSIQPRMIARECRSGKENRVFGTRCRGFESLRAYSSNSHKKRALSGTREPVFCCLPHPLRYAPDGARKSFEDTLEDSSPGGTAGRRVRKAFSFAMASSCRGAT